MRVFLVVAVVLITGCSTFDVKPCVIGDVREGCVASFAAGTPYQGAGDAGSGEGASSGEGAATGDSGTSD